MSVGDSVCSNIIHTMIGKVIRLVNNDNAIVTIDNREILVDLNYWHKVRT